MPKIRIGIDVLTAARARIAWTFDRFSRISLSFSAGKDSTAMLHLVMDEAIKRDRKVALLLIDLEGQYKITMDHALQCIEMYQSHLEVFWCCLPIHLRNAVSVYEPHWLCWDPEKKDAWIRTPPPIAITDPEHFPFFHVGMEFEEFVPEFANWYAKGELCACFVGIRSDESLNRYRTVTSRDKECLDGIRWTTLVEGTNNKAYNVYPIYDWRTEDIWVYHSKFRDRPYNKLYDLMLKAGLSIHQMRICQPYGDDQRKGLWLFHLVEPETWARVVARVNGANGGALYVQEWGNINGYRRVTKPVGHTWRSFCDLLVKSMPPKTQEHYENKILVFRKWWQERGYPEGIPDEADHHMEAARKVPSWRRVCKSLLKNDFWLKGLSFTQHKSEAYQKYLTIMRRRKEEWVVR